jgi:putative ABC transport system ATP-binding protein
VNTAIEVKDLSFRWKKGQDLCLDIPDFRVEKGERVFLYGPSGCGKSTLLSLLGGILLPEKGDITLLEQDIAKLSGKQRDKFRSDHIGFIFQQFNLIPYLTVLQNVMLPCHFSLHRSGRVLEKEAIEAAAKNLLVKLDLPDLLWDKKSNALSVGQQQRVALARALIGSPEILIADEPTSALDEDRQHAFLDLLSENCEASGATLLFVSHNHHLRSRFTREVSMAEINRAGGPDRLSAAC